jgi:hypothetical protein
MIGRGRPSRPDTVCLGLQTSQPNKPRVRPLLPPLASRGSFFSSTTAPFRCSCRSPRAAPAPPPLPAPLLHAPALLLLSLLLLLLRAPISLLLPLLHRSRPLLVLRHPLGSTTLIGAASTRRSIRPWRGSLRPRRLLRLRRHNADGGGGRTGI